MCNHTFKNNNVQHCEWEQMFSSPEIEKVSYRELPHDSEGRCIFHSTDLQWKRENNFSQWLKELVLLLDKRDDVIELDDIVLVGDSLMEKQNAKYRFRTNAKNELYCIVLENLLCNHAIVLRNAVLEDPLILERCCFKNDLIITDCLFNKGLSVNHLTTGQDFQILNCYFKDNIVTDSNNTVYGCWYINNSTFTGDSNFSGMAINDCCIIDDNIFNHVESNTNFNCYFGSGLEFRNNKSTDIGFDHCNFYYDSIFHDFDLSGQFLMTQPIIGGQLKFVGSETKPLFNPQTRIEISSDNFEENGLITFDYCNLIDLGTVFIANCRELEIEERIRILPSCKVDRLTVVHVYKPYKELKSNIIEDLAHLVTRYFRYWHSINLSVNIVRNRAESCIKVIFKTTDEITEEHFHSLLKDFPATVYNPSDDTPEVEDIKRALLDILNRICTCKGLNDYEKKELLTFNFNFNIMTKDIKLEKSQVGMLVMGTGHNIQNNQIEQTYQSDKFDFDILKHELEKVSNEIQKNRIHDIIGNEQLEQLRQAVEEHDERLVFQYLKKVPIAFLRFAKDVGANLLAGIIQGTIGL